EQLQSIAFDRQNHILAIDRNAICVGPIVIGDGFSHRTSCGNTQRNIYRCVRFQRGGDRVLRIESTGAAAGKEVSAGAGVLRRRWKLAWLILDPESSFFPFDTECV